MTFSETVANFAQSATSAVVDGLVYGIGLATAYLPGIFFGVTMVAVTYLATVLLYALYLSYCTAVKFKADGRLATMPTAVRGHIYAIVYFALLLDIAFNVVIGSIVYVELPEFKRLTFTARCQKWKEYGANADWFNGKLSRLDHWRIKVARYVCESWLNPGDPGHC
jgi:hypothetical protein